MQQATDAVIYKVQIRIWESQSGLPPNHQRGQSTSNHVDTKLLNKHVSACSEALLFFWINVNNFRPL